MIALLAIAHGAELAGAEFPERVTVGGEELVLNGLGVREKFLVDVYVGALYLPAATHDPRRAIEPDVPKRLVMHFVFRVPAGMVRSGIAEGFASVPESAAMPDHVQRMIGWAEAAHPGDEIVVDYVPGTGSTVTVGGVPKGTIAGPEFMRVLVAVFVGDRPPTEALREGLLGLR